MHGALDFVLHADRRITAAERVQELCNCGQALFGTRWHEPMSRRLGVTSKTIRRWLSGEYVVPNYILHRLVDVLFKSASTMREQSDRIERDGRALTAKLICEQEPMKEAA